MEITQAELKDQLQAAEVIVQSIETYGSGSLMVEWATRFVERQSSMAPKPTTAASS
jgi:hypothetical protein